jgi:hypothetical protein
VEHEPASAIRIGASSTGLDDVASNELRETNLPVGQLPRRDITMGGLSSTHVSELR